MLSGKTTAVEIPFDVTMWLFTLERQPFDVSAVLPAWIGGFVCCSLPRFGGGAAVDEKIWIFEIFLFII